MHPNVSKQPQLDFVVSNICAAACRSRAREPRALHALLRLIVLLLTAGSLQDNGAWMGSHEP